MPTGKVKFFNSVRGFGFIVPDDGGPDQFVHASAAERSGVGPLKEGDRLEYELVHSRDNKMKAANLRLLTQALRTARA